MYYIFSYNLYISRQTLPRLPVYNCSVQDKVFVTQRQMIDAGLAVIKARPLPSPVFYPKTEVVESILEFKIKVILYIICFNNYYDFESIIKFQFILFNVIPGVFVDLLLRLAGRKPM